MRPSVPLSVRPSVPVSVRKSDASVSEDSITSEYYAWSLWKTATPTRAHTIRDETPETIHTSKEGRCHTAENKETASIKAEAVGVVAAAAASSYMHHHQHHFQRLILFIAASQSSNDTVSDFGIESTRSD